AGASKVKLPGRDGCLASSFISAEELTPLVVVKAARLNGVWLSQAFGIATYYDELGPGRPEPAAEQPLPDVHGAVGEAPAILTGDLGRIDPEDIESYAAAGGYTAITRAVTEMTPAEVVDELAVSGLRGRGGSGFATGRKWKTALEAEAPAKYVICNGGEGDPGSFKDRALIEKNPHAVIEGMLTAGYAIGAREGFICMKASDRTAVARMERAVGQARERGLLGEQFPGTGFEFEVSVVALPEAYMGGEETALISTLEGKRPQARVRPPYPAQEGLHGRPTVVENVETLATIPWIMRHGAKKFLETGAQNAPGTKLFTVYGAVNRPGIYEAPLNISVKRLVEEGGGGGGGPAPGAGGGGA
ncbi:MAG: SLBB domain-containing protein, partial [Pseudomonadota bacterium]